MGYKFIDLDVRTIYGTASVVAKVCPNFGTVDDVITVDGYRLAETSEPIFEEVWRMFREGELEEFLPEKI